MEVVEHILCVWTKTCSPPHCLVHFFRQTFPDLSYYQLQIPTLKTPLASIWALTITQPHTHSGHGSIIKTPWTLLLSPEHSKRRLVWFSFSFFLLSIPFFLSQAHLAVLKVWPFEVQCTLIGQKCSVGLAGSLLPTVTPLIAASPHVVKETWHSHDDGSRSAGGLDSVSLASKNQGPF